MSGELFFTSDTHLGHGNIIKYCNRPFLADVDKEALKANGGVWHNGKQWKGHPNASTWRMSREAIEMMDDALIDNINKTVGENDILWHLGDFSFAKHRDYEDTVKAYRRRIACKHLFMIFGNHDKVGIDNIIPTYDMRELRIGDIRVVLCHYAMAVWNKSHRGSWHLYGHSHSNFERWANENMPNRRSMDVGVDNAAKLLGSYRPFAYDEIKQIMSTKTGFYTDHHIPKDVPTEEELV